MLVYAFVFFFSFWVPSIGGSRFDPSKVKPLQPPPSEFFEAEGLVSYYGYKAETHEVQTEDGYRLPLVHIASKPGPPVLLLMGLGLGPELWVLHGPGHDLGFILSDMGYDVWLGSQRGNYGTSHVHLNISQPEFWDFSHDESGYYDLPAMIDLILATTGYTTLYYVGTSLGSTLYMVLCSERPEYQAAFNGSVHFAPAMWIPRRDQFTQETKIFLASLEVSLNGMELWGEFSITQRNHEFQNWLSNTCVQPIRGTVCMWLMNFINGFNRKNMAPGWEGYTLAQTLSGSSVRAAKHLIQLTKKGGTEKYDWGEYENLKRYGSYNPPSYNLSKITTPTAIYYSTSDKLIRYSATRMTFSQIGNLRHYMEVPDPTYGHAELIFGKDLYKLLYSDVVNFLDSLSGLK